MLLLLSHFVVSDSVRPHRWQPTRLPHPWDSPGKNTGVGCHFLLQCMKVKSESEIAQLCPTLCDSMDCSLPGSSIHGIFQARVLEWGAIAFSNKILYITVNDSLSKKINRNPGIFKKLWKNKLYSYTKTCFIFDGCFLYTKVRSGERQGVGATSCLWSESPAQKSLAYTYNSHDSNSCGLKQKIQSRRLFLYRCMFVGQRGWGKRQMV